MNLLAVALGGALGSLARYLLALQFPAGVNFFSPGILIANTAGCLMFGFFWRLLAVHPHEVLKLFLLTGFMGGLTTFSTYAFEIMDAHSRTGLGPALTVTVLHLVLGVGAVFLGALCWNLLA